jgi:microcystin degradation protein MlrC
VTGPRRILVVECIQEVSTFNPVPSDTGDFDIRTGEEFFAAHRGHETEVGGALEVFEAAGVAAVPGFGAWAYASTGTLTSAAFRTLSDEFLAAVTANAGVDGVYACLHGSMVADDEADPEGSLLAETRRIVGDAVPVVVSLDLHGVLTRRMLREADATVFT